FVKETSIVLNLTKDFPATYLSDGNIASFEAMAYLLKEQLIKEKVVVKHRFFKRQEYGLIMHEFQFKLNSKSSQLVFNDVVSFINLYKEKEFNNGK
ncbi:MAG: alpha/beta hydrolase, partial [Bacilli bacterium]